MGRSRSSGSVGGPPGSTLGTHDSLLESANFIATIERRQGLKIACLEEIALEMGFVTHDEMARHVETMPNSSYRTYVESVLAEYS